MYALLLSKAIIELPLTLVITCIIGLLTYMFILFHNVYRLESIIKKLYEVLGDLVMPWRINPIILGGLIAAIIMAIGTLLL